MSTIHAQTAAPAHTTVHMGMVSVCAWVPAAASELASLPRGPWTSLQPNPLPDCLPKAPPTLWYHHPVLNPSQGLQCLAFTCCGDLLWGQSHSCLFLYQVPAGPHKSAESSSKNCCLVLQVSWPHLKTSSNPSICSLTPYWGQDPAGSWP